MSQEQPPIRSRRELRKARDAAGRASAPTGGDQPSPATKPSPAGPAPQQKPVVPVTPSGGKPAARPAPADATGPVPAEQAPAVPATTQRSSQIRARDRATLRAIKELEEKEGQLAAGGPPTRRQLRLQQLKEQTLTAANPVVQPAAEPAAQPGAQEPTTPATAGKGGGRDSGSAPAGPGEKPDRPAPPGSGPAGPAGMTVEQALAARALIAEQAKNQIAKMEHIASLDPEAVDPDILAEQIALAERAAVMNRRAMAKQKLAEQAGGSPAPQGAQTGDGKQKPEQPKDRPGPSTTSNLAMVTPLEFVQVPGVDRPVMKPPATSHVPVTTRPGTKVPSAGGGKRRPASRTAPAGKPGPSATKPGTAAEPASGRSQVIARAEAAARAATRPKPVVFPETQSGDLFEDLPRVPASSAYGLEPLEGATAGLARARRNRILQFCILAFGLVALVSGVVLIISGMNP